MTELRRTTTTTTTTQVLPPPRARHDHNHSSERHARTPHEARTNPAKCGARFRPAAAGNFRGSPHRLAQTLFRLHSKCSKCFS